jgi:hypothetical protein
MPDTDEDTLIDQLPLEDCTKAHEAEQDRFEDLDDACDDGVE